MPHLERHAGDLFPELNKVWQAAGGKTSGTWQQVFLLECDTRARQRTVVVTVLGE